ncbi:MAG: hypothetical protein V2A55_00120 [Candidatus Jorgensenbacteria bacterium]
MNKTCAQCKNQYDVTPDDFGFYEKMGVPVPVLCPDCRFRRRAVFRNEMMLYSRKCELCNKSTLSMYHPSSLYKIYCRDCWLSDKWDPYEYGRDYDFSRPFFEQLAELLLKVPKAGIFASSDLGLNINSDWTNFSGGNKDCYMIFNSGPRNENCSYSRGLIDSRDVFDVYFGNNVERAYEGVNVHKSNGVVWGQNVLDSIDSWFLLDCVGCQNCFGCVNLRQKSYHFFNEPLEKGEWQKRVDEITGSYKKLEEARREFDEFSLKFPRRENSNLKNINCVGDYIFESKNCKDSFEVSFSEDCRNLFSIKYAKSGYDLLGHGRQSELLLEGVAVGSSTRVIGSWWCMNSHDVEYSIALRGSEHCFGCDSLRKSRYSILNKRYSETEYKKIREHIVNELKAKNLYGLYMPPELAFFAYNETIGQDNLPLTKEEAIKRGFRWQEDLQMTTGKETLKPEQIPDHIKDVTDNILKEVLACISCGRNYRITKQELDFYKRMNIPIPRKCFYCRHADRLRRRGPFKLFNRTCAKCGKGIQTTYAPERPEIVYCETCYQKEVI